jgi:hypothetical protein
MLPDRVLSAMETGSMVTMANGRSAPERRAIAEFVTGKTFATAPLHHAVAARHVHAGQRAVLAGQRAGLERLGWEHLEHALPEHRRPQRRRRAQAETEVGLRLPRRSAVLLPHHDRRAAASSSAAGAARCIR